MQKKTGLPLLIKNLRAQLPGYQQKLSEVARLASQSKRELRGIKLSLWLLNSCVVAISFAQETSEYSALRGNGMQFTPNLGQVVDADKKLQPDVLYKGSGAGIEVYLRKSSVSYVLTNERELTHEIDEQVEEMEEEGKVTEANEMHVKDSLLALSLIKVHRVDMDFVGADSNSKVIQEEAVEGHLNFYYPHCKEGITGVKQYNKVIYEEMYQGIDVVYYGDKEGGLKYDIIVKPHSDPRQIKLQFKGAENIRLNENRDKLSITTSVGLLDEYMPNVYQKINGKIIDVEAEYLLSQKSEVGSQKETILTFKFGTFNPSYPLIIDPWVTYYGGSKNETSTEASITTDISGNIIFSGVTASLDLPISPGAFQAVNNGHFGPIYGHDAFLVKLTNSGTRVFATYFGGSGHDNLCGLSADANGNIFATGQTYSVDFPTLDPGGGAYFDNTLNSDFDAVITKFDPSGILLWSTYFGGGWREQSYDDFINIGPDTDIDQNGNLIVVGKTSGTDFYTLLPSQPNNAGYTDGFISKFNNSGVCQWSTYYGGESGDVITGVAIDNNNNAFITGYTLSSNFPTNTGAFQTSYNGRYDYSCFISKIDPSGNMVWSTYYGGENREQGEAIATDGLNNVMVSGWTASTDFPVSVNAYQSIHNGGLTDAFLVKFNNDGTRQWATYYGGGEKPAYTTQDPQDYANGIATDSNNNIVISGDTYSIDFPVTSCAFQTDFRGTEDQFIATFAPDGSLICSGYLGNGDASAENNETHTLGGSIAISGNYAYLLADTECNYPVTDNAFQSQCAGGLDLAVSQICILSCGINTSFINVEGNSSICAGGSTNYSTNTVSCGSNYQWFFEGGIPPVSNDQNPENIIYPSSGVYDVKLVVTTACGIDSITQSNLITVYDSLQVSASVFNDTICAGDTISLNVEVSGSNGVYSYNWQPGNLKTSKITVSPPGTTQYTVTVSSLPCSINKQTYTTIYTYALPTATYTYEPAEPFIVDNIYFINKSVSTNTIVSYDWLFGDKENSISSQEHPQFTFPDTGHYIVSLVVENIHGCRDTVLDTLRINASYLFYVPNSFTPNEDNINDVFKIHALVTNGFSLRIYDRWGNLIFETRDINNSWDGKVKGSNQQAHEDVYVYSIEASDFNKKEYHYNGRVILIR